jgi:hypothetical protein
MIGPFACPDFVEVQNQLGVRIMRVTPDYAHHRFKDQTRSLESRIFLREILCLEQLGTRTDEDKISPSSWNGFGNHFKQKYKLA